MSNSAAIAAVTATLRNLLTAGVTNHPDLIDATVTMQPLDRARANGNSANQINIFLYHVQPSQSWRNTPYPGAVQPGESGAPVLGLNLYYLITAFGRDNDAQRPFSHHLLGRAMSTLHAHPLLGADEIRLALPDNDLWNQVERVRFTLQPFSIEEIAKLWTGFQTQYRLSIAYEAAVVLIESTQPTVTPLPVLTRGDRSDRGILSNPNLLSPFPTIVDITLPKQQTSALLGDTVTLAGRNLSGDQVRVRFTNPHLANPIELQANVQPIESPEAPDFNDSEVVVAVPNDPALLPAGHYVIAVVMGREGTPDHHTSNEKALDLAPQITSQERPIRGQLVQGVATIRLTCKPPVRPEQRVSLLLGSREIPAASRAETTDALSFVVTDAVAGEFRIRLRVDGVDSQLVDHSQKLPTFIDTEKALIG